MEHCKVILAFIAVLLTTVWGQSGMRCVTEAQESCYFPFKYNNEEYAQCTREDHDQLWCATTESYDRDGYWGNCECNQVVQNNGDKTKSGGKDCSEYTDKGDKCVGTFTYKNVKYTGCPTVRNGGIPWCSLDATYNGNWGNCTVPLKCVTPQSGTGCRETTKFGAVCAKSFIYNKVNYTGCTTVAYGGKPWCSLTDNYDKDKQYGDCSTPLLCASSGDAGPGCRELTTFGTMCLASFIYNGKNYTGCTNVDAGGRAWCSLTANYDRTKPPQYAYCKSPLRCVSAPRGSGCFEQTTDDGYCQSEYTYQGMKYVGCTDVDYDKAWCCKSKDCDKEFSWGTCKTPLKCFSSTFDTR